MSWRSFNWYYRYPDDVYRPWWSLPDWAKSSSLARLTTSVQQISALSGVTFDTHKSVECTSCCFGRGAIIESTPETLCRGANENRRSLCELSAAKDFVNDAATNARVLDMIYEPRPNKRVVFKGCSSKYTKIGRVCQRGQSLTLGLGSDKLI